MNEGPSSLVEVMDARRRQLDMRWKDVADTAGVSEETIRLVRRGGRDCVIRTTKTEAKIERALGWEPGSIRAIREGGQATPLPGTPDGGHTTLGRQAGTPPINRNGRSYPPFAIGDPGYRAIWEIPDELLPETERRYAIHQIELLRWVRLS